MELICTTLRIRSHTVPQSWLMYINLFKFSMIRLCHGISYMMIYCFKCLIIHLVWLCFVHWPHYGMKSCNNRCYIVNWLNATIVEKMCHFTTVLFEFSDYSRQRTNFACIGNTHINISIPTQRYGQKMKNHPLFMYVDSQSQTHAVT